MNGSPIFAEIVPEKSRTSVYALDKSFESVLSSFAPPVVGILAQHVYGYKQIPKGSSSSEEIETDRENAESLAKALYSAIGIPMALCCIIYSFLYFTYPRDKERAKMEALIESEMQQLQLEDEVEYVESSSNNFVEIDVVYDEGGIGDDSTEVDEGDERTLLYRQLTFANLGR